MQYYCKQVNRAVADAAILADSSEAGLSAKEQMPSTESCYKKQLFFCPGSKSSGINTFPAYITLINVDISEQSNIKYTNDLFIYLLAISLLQCSSSLYIKANGEIQNYV